MFLIIVLKNILIHMMHLKRTPMSCFEKSGIYGMAIIKVKKKVIKNAKSYYYHSHKPFRNLNLILGTLKEPFQDMMRMPKMVDLEFAKRWNRRVYEKTVKI